MSFIENVGLFFDSVREIGKNYQDMKDGIKNDFQEEILGKSTYNKSKRSSSAQYGDVICVEKPGYYHYGIYIKDSRIIHFAPQNEFGSLREAMKNAVIHETNLSGFLGGGSSLFVCDFAQKYSEPAKRSVKYKLPGLSFYPDIIGDVSKNWFSYKKLQYKVYSPTETVERALSKIGQTNYNLVFNNCEHFAIWCKTGIKESHQVNNLLDMVVPKPIPIYT